MNHKSDTESYIKASNDKRFWGRLSSHRILKSHVLSEIILLNKTKHNLIQGIINWTHVLGFTSSVVLVVSPAQPLHLYKFGVSTVNGVIVWTYCQYSQSASKYIT